MLLGDSQANSAAGVFDILGKDAGLYGLMISAGNSPFLLDTDRLRKTESGRYELRGEFRRRNDDARKWIERGFSGKVVLAAAWHHYLAGESSRFEPGFKDALVYTLRYFEDRGNEVLIYLTIPELPDNPDIRCIALDEIIDPDANSRWLQRGDTCQELNTDYPMDIFKENRRVGLEALTALTAGIDGVRLIDPMDTLCDGSVCRSTLEGRYIYQDINHLNFSGGQAFGRLILKKQGNVLSDR